MREVGFHHPPERWPEFRRRYREELSAHGEALDALRQRAAQGTVTLVFSSREEVLNNAAVLRELLVDGG